MNRISRVRAGLAILGLGLALVQSLRAQSSVGATFGRVFPLQGGTSSDMMLDEFRHRLCLINNNIAQVSIFDYD